MNRPEIVQLDITAGGMAEMVHALHIAAYRVEAALLGVDSFPPLERTAQDLARSGEQFVGARLQGRLVGVVAWASGVRLEISSLVVDPPFHRQRVARAMLDEVITAAGQRPVRVSTAALNGPALGLYRQAGFGEAGRSWVQHPPLELVHLQREGPTG
ncbi:GNAT family N-acetyltransferase [Ideonella sp. YS5]|uniref:GNAT family N-acetyltransferase n=1 Tax=Ideonella sp. YS5 TaxID=3453714 RepID=UPI003EED57A6